MQHFEEIKFRKYLNFNAGKANVLTLTLIKNVYRSA
jgi:hypothetical protein